MDKIKKFLDLNPKTRKVVGVILIIIGTLSIVTPFTPVGFLLVVGLELLGFRYLLWERLKKWF